MSNIVGFRRSPLKFRDTSSLFHFHYTKVGKVYNEKTGSMQEAMVDTGIVVTLIPDSEMEGYPRKKLHKSMIEKFRRMNGDQLPSFRMEIVGDTIAA